MDNSGIFVVLGVVGSIASVIGLLIAAPGKKSKIIHAVYGLAITAIAGAAVDYHNRMSEAQREVEAIKRVEREAQAILDTSDRSTSGSMAGLILAGLSFLEKYKARFPETYSRAVKLSESAGLYEAKQSSISGSMAHFESLQEASGAMYFLLVGVAAGNSAAK